MTIAALLRDRLEDAGFPLHGLTRNLAPPHIQVYDAFIEAGYHGSMDYLERHRPLKTSPAALMPGARSLLVVALPYRAKRHISFRDKPQGPHISQYAWGRDYHRVIRKRLKRVLEEVKGGSGHSFNYRIFVDSAPILERDFAALVGLGWIGKNGCLIHPHWGSFLFIGGAILDVDPEPWGTPLPDHCGECRRCLEACPTGAFESRLVDTRRCIGAVTVESAPGGGGDLPRWGWIFGCDLCQEVCPFNRKSPLIADPDFAIRQGRDVAGRGDSAFLDEDSYAEFSRGAPLRRASWEKISENLLLASTPSGIRTLPPLAPSLRAALEEILSGGHFPSGTRIEVDLQHGEIACRPEDPALPPGVRESLLRWASSIQLARDYPIRITMG